MWVLLQESRNPGIFRKESRTIAYPPKKRISVFSQKEESTKGHCFAPPILPLVNRNNCGTLSPFFNYTMCSFSFCRGTGWGRQQILVSLVHKTLDQET